MSVSCIYIEKIENLENFLSLQGLHMKPHFPAPFLQTLPPNSAITEGAFLISACVH